MPEKQPINMDEVIQQTVSCIRTDPLAKNIEAILLCKHNPTKDTVPIHEIAVVFNNYTEKEDLTQFQRRMLSQTAAHISVNVFNILPAKLKKAIAIRHEVLYAIPSFDDTNFMIYEIKVYEDFAIRLRKAGFKVEGVTI